MSTKDWLEKDYYQALGVTKTATAAEIKKAYRKLARELHPDKNPGDAASEARFKEVSEAYDMLSDTAKRAEYDEARSLFGSGYSRTQTGAGPGASTFDMSDLFANAGGGGYAGGGGVGDIFGGLFGNAAGSRTTPRAAAPARGQDVSAEVSLSFNEAVHGATLPLQLSSPGTCKSCHGNGARPGTSPRRCPTCSGSGFISSNQGAFGFSEPCRACQGTGQIVDDPCPECGGTGATTQTRSITVRVPPGIRDGARLRIAGKGSPGARGGPSGDLFVTVRVGAHDLFGRSGDDLTLSLPITFAEATLGATVRVPTLDGSVSVKIAAGTPSGRTLRVRGRGVAKKSSTGDLLVTLDVAVPQKVNSGAREALEKYAAAQPDDPRPRITAALSHESGRHESGRHAAREHGHE